MRRLCQKCAKCGRPMLALVVWACDGLVVEGLGWPRTGRGSRQAGVIPERVRGKVVAHTSPHHNRTQPPSIKSHTTTHKIAHHHHQPTAHHPFFFPTRTPCERQRARTAATEVTTTPPQDDRARESEWGEPSRAVQYVGVRRRVRWLVAAAPVAHHMYIIQRCEWVRDAVSS